LTFGTRGKRGLEQVTVAGVGSAADDWHTESDHGTRHGQRSRRTQGQRQPEARAENRSGSRVCRIVRDWLPTPLLLIACWAVGWPPVSCYRLELERSWVQFDKALLLGWGGKAAVESLGRTLPLLLGALTTYALRPAFAEHLHQCVNEPSDRK